MQKQSAFYFLLIFLMCSCGQNSTFSDKNDLKVSTKVDSLYKLVMAKHDEVMPKTSDITKHTKILRQKLEGTKNNSEKENILSLLQKLQSADDAMLEWMHDFKNIHLDKDFYENKSEKELVAYLKEEEIKIDNVAKQMLESIGNADLYLKANNK